MQKTSQAFGFALALTLNVAAQATNTPAPASSPAVPAERARVFITDSQSWEIAGAGGGANGAYGSSVHGGARPQTAEIVKTFGERCPDVITNNIQAKTDYIVVLDHEGGKGALRHKNKVAVFNRVTGDSVMSKSTLSLGGSVQAACEAVAADWAKNWSSIRAAETAEESAKSAPPVAAPQVQPASTASVTKLTINSDPAGADIELDGGFVGNTPSTIEIPTGDHAVRISKTGYKDWERKLKASGGSVNLNAQLESTPR